MKLVFVYNADSGPVSGLFDIGHKLFSPETYQCGLCSLTHDTFSEKEAWKEFREKTDIEMEFLHRDEFEKKYEASYDYPVVLRSNGHLDILLSKKDIDAIEDVRELIEKITSLVT
ncbi:MAG: GTPase [Prosthecochloris sp.]|uniref:GTPase n=1 Tax=Prosthecochloris sp. ZM_2 TaxID=2045206 RepID=UPI000DF742D8|nr:GTPase [Prosthecochloris sp. ZM_2]MEC9487851.1 GTPase [Prosthecochloris sp.]RNA64742.1 GTPase [Prosthecochloris sp. ZM_2]